MKKVSIIIRTKNEERWINACLNSVFSQDFKDFEVIMVDDNSKDRTLDKAKKFPLKIINYKEQYKPGKAINLGIKNSSGEYLVMLSGHCVPVNNNWLGEFVKEIEKPEIAGVYGRQEPLPFSSALDKRDLLITFGLDKRVQVKDSFFHNANSIIKREVWETIPFSEEALRIEDRIWAKEVLKRGYKIVYTPEASVYHYHGIHQNADPKRAEDIINIIKNLEPEAEKNIDINQSKIAAVIPIKGEIEYLGGKPLLEYTIKRAFESKYLNLIAVTTDNPVVADLARSLGVNFIFIYPPELSDEHIEIQEVFKYAVSEFEKMEIIPDIMVYLSPRCPFRPKNLIDGAIVKLINGGYDSIIPVLPEYRSCWTQEENKLKRLDKGYIPSKFKEPLYIGLSGLITAFYVDTVKKGESRLGERIGTIELKDMIYSIDTGKTEGIKAAELLIKNFWETG